MTLQLESSRAAPAAPHAAAAADETQPAGTQTPVDTWLPAKALKGIRVTGRDAGEGSSGVFGQGGAGVALVTPRHSRVALFLRSPHVDCPGTWALPGGARTVDAQGNLSDPLHTAVHELYEELHHLPWGAKLLTRPQVTAWRGTDYHTFIMEVPFPQAYEPQLNYEHEAWGWFSLSQMQTLALHPGVSNWLTEHDPLRSHP